MEVVAFDLNPAKCYENRSEGADIFQVETEFQGSLMKCREVLLFY